MLKVPIATSIANAAAGLDGSYGQVTHRANLAVCSRQTAHDHAWKVRAAVEAEHQAGPTRAESVEQDHHRRREEARLRGWLARTIESPEAEQEQFAVAAAATGPSLNRVVVLLALLPGRPAGPGRSTVHRRIKAAGSAA